MNYRDIIKESPEFYRSVRIDRDHHRDSNTFVITPIFLSLLQRMVDGLISDGPRAISITGPYGSGKSVSMMHLARILQHKDPALVERVLKIKPSLRESLNSVFNVVPVYVTGTSGTIAKNIMNSLASIDTIQTNKDLMIAIYSIQNTDTSHDLSVFLDLLNLIRLKCNLQLVLIIDEVGKHLEFAATHSDQNDIYLLQLLAEEAARSVHPKMLVVTILHQAFEEYSQRMIRNQREEFSKIQGRFEDVAFQVHQGDILQIIGEAINMTCRDLSLLKPIQAHVSNIAEFLYHANTSLETSSIEEFKGNCAKAAPLHPVVTLLLGPLFRQLAQNERSLFSFLGSNEPFGFQNFLEETKYQPELPILYSIADLYDYLYMSIGSALFHTSYGRRWAQIEEALIKIPEHANLTRFIIKSIGLLSLNPGTHHISINQDILSIAAGQNVREVLDELVSRRIVTYRKFSGSYLLWDGSDIDVEARIVHARSVLSAPDLISSLTDLVPLKPVAARKHYMKTGTLRWFDVFYVSHIDILNVISEQPPTQSDGRIYLITSSGIEQPPSIIPLNNWQVAIWNPIAGEVWDAIIQLNCLNWVKKNTPDLLHDDVARREVKERIYELEQFIDGKISNIVFRPDLPITIWTQEEQCKIISGSDVNTLVSEICDKVYSKTPIIVSDFVNRNSLSSTITAARNDVIQRMVRNPDSHNLGITGYPPQLPIYLSTLLQTGLHQCVDGEYLLTAPDSASPWHEAWLHFEMSISDKSLSVKEIWDELSDKPFGIRKGLLPILTTAFLLVNRNRISVMEQGSFVPTLTEAIFERLSKIPERFSVRIAILKGTRKIFLEKMLEAQLLHDDFSDEDLFSIVRPLVAFAYKLPEFVKNTASIDSNVIGVRDTLLNAKDPVEMLFYNLPKALGNEAIGEDTDPSGMNGLVEEIRKSVIILSEKYSYLLANLFSRILEEFGVNDLPEETALIVIVDRAKRLVDYIEDLGMKSIIRHMAVVQPREIWTEFVASSIFGKSPKVWYDRNVDEFQDKLKQTVHKIQHFETVISSTSNPELLKQPGVVRIGITKNGIDNEIVLTQTPNQLSKAVQIANKIMSTISRTPVSRDLLLMIAAELMDRALSEEERGSTEDGQ